MHLDWGFKNKATNKRYKPLYEINKLQGYIVPHRKYSWYFIVTLNRV